MTTKRVLAIEKGEGTSTAIVNDGYDNAFAAFRYIADVVHHTDFNEANLSCLQELVNCDFATFTQRVQNIRPTLENLQVLSKNRTFSQPQNNVHAITPVITNDWAWPWQTLSTDIHTITILARQTPIYERIQLRALNNSRTINCEIANVNDILTLGDSLNQFTSDFCSFDIDMIQSSTVSQVWIAFVRRIDKDNYRAITFSPQVISMVSGAGRFAGFPKNLTTLIKKSVMKVFWGGEDDIKLQSIFVAGGKSVTGSSFVDAQKMFEKKFKLNSMPSLQESLELSFGTKMVLHASSSGSSPRVAADALSTLILFFEMLIVS